MTSWTAAGAEVDGGKDQKEPRKEIVRLESVDAKSMDVDAVPVVGGRRS